MASVGIRVDSKTFDEFMNRFKAWKPDFRKPLEQCGIRIQRSVDLNFRAEGRPSRWAGLSDLTKMNRRKGRKKKGGGEGTHKILQDTGTLRKSIVTAMRAAPGAIYEIKPDMLKIGTNLPYAAIHQWGGTIKPKDGKKALKIPKGRKRKGKKQEFIFRKMAKIPQRQYLLVQSEDLKYFERIFHGWARKELGLDSTDQTGDN